MISRHALGAEQSGAHFGSNPRIVAYLAEAARAGGYLNIVVNLLGIGLGARHALHKCLISLAGHQAHQQHLAVEAHHRKLRLKALHGVVVAQMSECRVLDAHFHHLVVSLRAGAAAVGGRHHTECASAHQRSNTAGKRQRQQAQQQEAETFFHDLLSF